ncbi:F-box-like protein [Carex littledalei]|uniref:F-box-like protein n=1 Tax=Carex littledalei TaxID=544730 RepID=A0A833VFC8_9POAL|nr:F-box-like protein [Carex littledalei]
MGRPPPFGVPLAPVQPPQDAANLPLDVDLLAEIFRHLDNPASLIKCLLVCRRFYHVISSVLHTTPFFLGFYHVPNNNRVLLPQYINTNPHFTNPNLSLTYLNSETSNKYSIVESRGGRVLLRKMVHGLNLYFVLASPFEQSSVAIESPPLFDVRIHRLVVCAYVPWTPPPNEEYKIVVVFSDKESGAQFTVMGFSSLTHSWTSLSHNQNGGVKFPKKGYPDSLEPTVFAGRMLYKCQNVDYILAVNPSTLLLSKIDLPVSEPCLLCDGNYCLGRTEDDNLCFFLMLKMDLFVWVYLVNNNSIGRWFPHELEDVNKLMDVYAIEMGEVAGMRLSARMEDQMSGFRLVTLNGFGEGSGVLILVMADWVVSYRIKSKKLEVLWCNDDWRTRVQGVYAYEMQWPPVPMRRYIGEEQGACFRS